MELGKEKTHLCQERIDLIRFLEDSIHELSSTNGITVEDYLAGMDPVVQTVMRVYYSIAKSMGRLRDSFARTFSHSNFRHIPTAEEIATMDNLSPWERNPNYLLTRLMGEVKDILRSSESDTLEADVAGCIDNFAKRHPNFQVSIDNGFLNRVRYCALSETAEI